MGNAGPCREVDSGGGEIVREKQAKKRPARISPGRPREQGRSVAYLRSKTMMSRVDSDGTTASDSRRRLWIATCSAKSSFTQWPSFHTWRRPFHSQWLGAQM